MRRAKQGVQIARAGRVLSLLLLTLGCVGGRLDGPEDDVMGTQTGGGDSGGTSGMGTGGSAPTYCDAVTQVLGTSCGGFVCHGSPGRNALVYIDLVNAPDEQTLGEYLVGRRADYTRVSDADSCPTGSPELLIDPQFPERSLILTKVLGTQACGDNMPSTGSLSPAQIECLTEWVSGVAAATPPE